MQALRRTPLPGRAWRLAAGNSEALNRLRGRRAAPNPRPVIRGGHIQQVQRLPWLAAAFVLLAMRLLSPAGFMPDWKGPAFALQLCDGVVAAPAIRHHGQHNHQPAPAHHQPCPFAVAAAHAGVAPADAVRVDPPAEAEALPPTFAIPAAQRQEHRDRPRARGPPRIA